jgi:hypothetical protein
MSIKTTFHYKFSSLIKSAFIFFGVLSFILLAMTIWIGFFQRNHAGTSSFFSGYTLGASIMMLVVGICSIREDLRMFIQNGFGRKTTYITEFLVAVAISAVIALGGELFLILGGAVASSFPDLYISDLYPLLYAGGSSSLTLAQHMSSMALTVSLLTMMFLGGMFFSLLFYILSKKWTIAVAIALPLSVFGVLPGIVLRFSRQALALADFAGQSSWNLCLIFLIIAMPVAGINWALTRRIHIRGL